MKPIQQHQIDITRTGFIHPPLPIHHQFLPLDEAIASSAVIAIVSWTVGRTETLLEPAKVLKNGKGKTTGANGKLSKGTHKRTRA